MIPGQILFGIAQDNFSPLSTFKISVNLFLICLL